MKTNFLATRTMAVVLASSLCLQTGLRSVQAAQDTTEADFRYVIPYEPGTSAFAAGDQITIASVRGNRMHLERDGAYLVQGSYTLASVDRAEILFSCTTPAPSSPTPITDGQDLKVTRGTGTFSLKHRTRCDGWFHVSFHVAGEGRSHCGIYFGETGSEKTILRKADWPDLSSETTREQRTQAIEDTGNDETRFSAQSNRRIMA